MTQTFVCDTCKKAIDLDPPSNVILNPTRCIITKACRGTLTNVSKNSVNSDQYMALSDSSAWEQIPMLYQHNQLAPRKVWTVNHNLSAQPMVQIYLTGAIEALNVNLYTVNYLSSSQLQVTFNTAQTGTAECLVRSNTLPVVTKNTVVSTANFLISPNSVLTLAIPTDNISFVLAVYGDSLTPIAQLAYTVGKTTSRIASPWRNFTSVVFNGRRFTLVDVQTNINALANQTYSASFAMLQADGVTPFPAGSYYVILSQDPYTDESDRIINQCLDVATISNKQNTVFDSGDLYCLEQSIETLYPPIIAL